MKYLRCLYQDADNSTEECNVHSLLGFFLNNMLQDSTRLKLVSNK